MSIGENIKRLRKDRGLTQKELAEKSSLSRSYLADLERDRYNPSLESLQLISDSLEVNVSVLLGESDSVVGKSETQVKGKVDELEEGFPEGVYVLRRASKELSPEAKEQMLKIMKTFLEEDDDKE